MTLMQEVKDDLEREKLIQAAGGELLGFDPDGSLWYEQAEKPKKKQKRGLDPDVKKEIVAFLEHGDDPVEIAAAFGLKDYDIIRIGASVGVKPKPRPVLPPPAPVVQVAAEIPVPASPATPLAAPPRLLAPCEPVAPVRPPAPRIPVEPIAEGEHLFYNGLAARVEYSPFEIHRLDREFDALRHQSIRSADTTEYELLERNIMMYADGLLRPNASTGRFKFFKDRRGRTVYEFKGCQARLFVGLMTSRYQGLEVKRCGLLYVVVKKRDNHKETDLDLAAKAGDAWREWREEQDAKIARKIAG